MSFDLASRSGLYVQDMATGLLGDHSGRNRGEKEEVNARPGWLELRRVPAAARGFAGKPVAGEARSKDDLQTEVFQSFASLVRGPIGDSEPQRDRLADPRGARGSGKSMSYWFAVAERLRSGSGSTLRRTLWTILGLSRNSTTR